MEREEVASNQRARLYGAMIESVNQRGYPATTVAHVIALAGVSRRAFYEQFRNKEHCFLATYDILVARQRKRVIEAWNSEHGWSNRLVLIDALAVAGARERMHLAGLTFERLLATVFAHAPDGPGLPALTTRAVVGGIRHVVFLRMLEGRHGELYALTDEVIDWIESYRSPATTRLGVAGRGRVRLEATGARAAFLQGQDDRARALAALVDLTVAAGYASLTDNQIAQFAGISADAFHQHFRGKEECFLAVLDEFIREALAVAREPLESAPCWPQAVDRAMRAFVEYLLANQALLRIAFIDLFELGSGLVGRLTRSVEAFTDLLTEAGPPPRRGPAVAREALTGAIWAVLATFVGGEGPSRLPWLADQLTFIVLAPYIGPREAIEAIQEATGQPHAA
jgi:AcrR family transcriptional regulator